MAKLFYVIGASGVGKDSILDFARQHFPYDAPFVFSHRYITRPADAGGENHVALSEQEFLLRQRQGCFAMSWYSHSTHYGIGIEINHWLNNGKLNVIVNGSRAYLDEASQLYKNCIVPVLICAKPEVLRQRLLERGRENTSQIEERLSLAESLNSEVSHPELIKLDNNKSLEEAGNRFIKLLSDKAGVICS